MLTPMDIHNREFKKGFRGYSEEDVDTFMDQLAVDYEKVYREYCEMKETTEKMKDKLGQYEKMESTMNSTLMLAQETAENVKVSARKEAELILQEAESKKKQMLEESSMNLQNAEKEYDRLRNQISTFRAKVQSILVSQMHMLEEMKPKESTERIPVEQLEMKPEPFGEDNSGIATAATAADAWKHTPKE